MWYRSLEEDLLAPRDLWARPEKDRADVRPGLDGLEDSSWPFPLDELTDGDDDRPILR